MIWKDVPDAQVNQIRSAFANGSARKALAASFGVSIHIIRAIISGRTWKHVAVAA